MRKIRYVALTLLLAGSGAGTLAQPAAPASAPHTSAVGASTLPFWTGTPDAATFERNMDARLAHARQLLGQLAASKGPRTIENTLRVYDDIQLELDAVGQQALLIQSA